MAKRYMYFKEAKNNEYGAPIHKGDVAEISDDALAQQFKDEGVAVEIDGSIAIKAEADIDNLYDEYATKIKAIKESEDPIYDNESKRQFDISQLKSEREDKHQALMVEYEQAKKELVEEAKKEQALTVTRYSDSDSEKVKHIVERFKTNTFVSYESAIAELINAMDYMTMEQLAAMKPFLVEIREVINANEEDSAQAAHQFASIVDTVKKSDPIPIASAFSKLPFSGSLSSRAAAVKAFESTDKGNKVEKHRSSVASIVNNTTYYDDKPQQ